MEPPSSMELRAMLVSVAWGPGGWERQDEHESGALSRDPVCAHCSEMYSRSPSGPDAPGFLHKPVLGPLAWGLTCRAQLLAQIPSPSLSHLLPSLCPRRAAVPRGSSFFSPEALNATSKLKHAP